MTITEFLQSDLSAPYPMADYFYPKIIDDENFVGYINYMSVLDRYHVFMNDYIETVELSIEEAEKYRFSPKQVSKLIYGSTHLWWLLLHANQMHTMAQFDFTETLRMKVFTADGLKAANSCLNAANTQMNMYKEQAVKDKKTALAKMAKAEYEATQKERKLNLGSGALRMSEKLQITKLN